MGDTTNRLFDAAQVGTYDVDTNPLLAAILRNPVGTQYYGPELTNPSPDFVPFGAQGEAMRQQAMQQAPAITLGMSGGGLTIAGPKSLTADLAALDRAKGMAAQGAERHDIWNQTGWFQGADGMWRYEIPDVGMQPRGMPASGSIPLDVSISHPDLFSAYPQLRNTQVSRIDNPMALGMFRPGDPAQIGLGRATPANLLHEVQHNVQAIEGTARGGGPMSGADYERLAGEVEARNTAARYKAGTWGHAVPPFQTYDIPESLQIVRK